ncbi:caspase family protein [Streptomyces sp. NPDC060048]|uniref:caspase, EACC1-associated type n=1 Tax=unclassified Streptomyces TaxID=2593676 RepID=UPI0036AB1164
MSPDRSRSRAILIGTSHYRDLNLRPLPAATCVSAMVELLTGEACGWPRDRVTAVEDIDTPRDAVVELVPLVRDVTDVLLVYYVGHGMRTRDGQLALALSGTVADPEILSDSALVYPRLMEVLRGSPAATKLVILDCCHAELGLDAEYHFQSGPGDLTGAYPVDGMYFIGASTRYEKAKSPLGGRLTHFTHSLIDVIGAGIPGKPAELTLRQIFVESRARLLRDKLPQPVDGGMRDAYQFPFARNAAYSPPSGVLEASEQAVEWNVVAPGQSPSRHPSPRLRVRRPGRRTVLLTAMGITAAAIPLVRTFASSNGREAKSPGFVPVPYARISDPGVASAAFSPDGKVLAGGNGNGTISLWDVVTRGRLATLTDFTGPSFLGVSSVAFSPDGTMLAGADSPDRSDDSRDGKISLWDVATRRRITVLTDPGVVSVGSVVFSPKGAILASANGIGTISLWSVAAHAKIATLTGAVANVPTATKAVNSIAFSPDGTILAGSTVAGLVELWDVATFAKMATLAGPGTGVGTLAFSPDGRTLAGVIGNKTVQLWDVVTHKEVGALGYTDDDSHGAVADIVVSLAFSPDGRFLAGGTGAGLLVVWDAATHTIATTLGRFTSSEVEASVLVEFSPDGGTLAAVLISEIRLWTLRRPSGGGS